MTSRTGLASVPSRRQAANIARSVSEQLTDISVTRSIMKKDIAAKMGVDPAYLAQMIARGMAPNRIEQMVEAINALDKSKEPKVQPYDFDAYAIAIIGEEMQADRNLLEVIRAAVFHMTESERALWQRMSLASRKP